MTEQRWVQAWEKENGIVKTEEIALKSLEQAKKDYSGKSLVWFYGEVIGLKRSYDSLFTCGVFTDIEKYVTEANENSVLGFLWLRKLRGILNNLSNDLYDEIDKECIDE